MGRELRENATNPDFRLCFMTTSYVLSLFFDCPPNMGLHCPSASAKQDVVTAILMGDLTWHAFPFNAEPELLSSDPDGVLMAASVEMAHMLDAKFGFAPKATLIQRDVPGMTRGIIPWLLASGVQAISVGVNSASTPPDVPKGFVWKDENTGKSVIGMLHPGGYGGIGRADAVIAPGPVRDYVLVVISCR